MIHYTNMYLNTAGKGSYKAPILVPFSGALVFLKKKLWKGLRAKRASLIG